MDLLFTLSSGSLTFDQILSLLAVFHASSAIPFGQLTSMMPRDVAYIGVDEDRGEYVAYNLNGTTYGRYAIDSKGESLSKSKRAAGRCAKLSIDELKTSV